MNTLLLTMTTATPNWHSLAHCRHHSDLPWVDAKPGGTDAERCKIICRQCPVRPACLAMAMENQEPWGVWGGLDTDERARLAEQSKLPTPRVLPPYGLNTRYVKHGCRCRPCREAHRIYVRQRRCRSAGTQPAA